MDGLQPLFDHIQRPEADLNALLQEAASFLARQFSLREVTIGLRGQDGLYRYEALVGVREDAEKAHKRITYTAADFSDDGKYKGTWLSKNCKLFLSEDIPYADDEKNSYSRQLLLGSKRKSLTDCIEGDYIDIYIRGHGEDIVGWIELSGTVTGELPDVGILRWAELVGSILGCAIRLKDAARA